MNANGRTTAVSNLSYTREQIDMETQIQQLEREAYSAVLRAFKAQADAITWEKEGLITELRKELRVSDEEHREILSRVNSDDVIWRIREWRKGGGSQSNMLGSAHPIHESYSGPTLLSPNKRQKSQLMHSLSFAAPSQSVSGSVFPSPSGLRRGSVPFGTRGKKGKIYPFTGSAGRGQVTNGGSSAAFPTSEPSGTGNLDALIGRKVLTRWPEDNSFYEAIITDYNAVEGKHRLCYDMNTPSETWEWVDLKEISPADVRWDGEDPGISCRGRVGNGGAKFMGRDLVINAASRGRGIPAEPSRIDNLISQSGIGKNNSGNIEMLHTDTLIKEVEKLFASNQPTLMEIEKVKKILKDQELALTDAIFRLRSDVSDGESVLEFSTVIEGKQRELMKEDGRNIHMQTDSMIVTGTRHLNIDD